MRRNGLAFLLILCCMAAAEVNRGADVTWTRSVESFTRALGDRDAEALLSLVDDARMSAFDAAQADGARLLARTGKGRLIMSRAYAQVPLTLASDLCECTRDSELPDDIKRKLAVGAEARARRLNAAAAEWISEALAAKPTDAIGVLVFWCPSSSEEQGADNGELVFVLLRAEASGARNWRIRTIAYGNPIKP